MAFTSSEFTPIEVAMFKNFLARIRTEVQRGSKRPWPDGECFELVQGCTSGVAIELILTRNNHTEFLLRRRTPNKDPGPWNGWHIPGGWLPGNCSIADKTRVIAIEDTGIKEIGSLQGPVAVQSWTGTGKPHPFGYPISLVFITETKSKARSDDRVKWFSDIPKGMADTDGRHEHYLRQFFAWRAGQLTVGENIFFSADTKPLGPELKQ